MPDLTDYPAIDVAIGLMVMFFLLSIVCSAIQELIASFLNLRARDLEKGLRELLGDDKAEGVEERLPGDRRSYIDARQFSLALLDTLAPEADRPNLLTQAKATASTISNTAVKVPLVRIIDEAQGDIAAARKGIEEWFDASMDRVTGWYRRRVQKILLVLAAIVAIGANADTFHVANQLWSDPALRASIVAKSNQILQTPPPAAAQGGSGAGGAATAPAPAAETCPPGKTAQQCIETKVDNVAKSVDGVNELKLPLGWDEQNKPDTAGEWAAKAAGILMTIFALSLGAPFWFDLLGKVSRLRAAGAKPPGSDTNNNEPKKD